MPSSRTSTSPIAYSAANATPRTLEAMAAEQHAEIATLRARIAELQRERDHLVAVVDILQEISTSLHFVDILQTIARKLGETFGLDRCSIFLTGEHEEVRLVASYEDPSIRNLVVDLARYPELKRAFESGETVFIPDAVNDPLLSGIKDRKSTRLNSSHANISYAVFCLKKKRKTRWVSPR